MVDSAKASLETRLLEGAKSHPGAVLAGTGLVLGTIAVWAYSSHKKHADSADGLKVEHGIDKIASKSFYLVQPADGNGLIATLTPEEAATYSAIAGSIPSEPELAIIGSGGSAKCFWLAGFLLELEKYIDINKAKFVVTSGSAFYTARSKLDLQQLEDFVLEIPELIAPNVSPNAMHSKLLMKIGMMRRLGQTENVNLNGRIVESPVGAFRIEKLAQRLYEIFGQNSRMDTDAKNFIIMAGLYDERDENGRPKVIALGKEYPEMPVPIAVLGAIAMELILPFQVYANHLIGDAGPKYNFPLLKEHFSDSATVIGIDLGYNNGSTAMSKLPRKLRKRALVDHSRNNETTTILMKDLTGKTPEEILNGDNEYCRDNPKVVYIAPKIPGMVHYDIRISMPQRKELIAEGRKAAQELVKAFRSPTVSVQYSSQAA